MTMAETTILKANGTKGAKVELADSLFGAPVHEGLVHQAVVRQMASRRTGTSRRKRPPLRNHTAHAASAAGAAPK